MRLAVVGEQLEERIGRERLGTGDGCPLPGPGREKLESGDRVDRRLEDDRLVSILTHGPLVVGDVVEVDRVLSTVLALPGDERAGAGLASHPVTERGRIGERGR